MPLEILAAGDDRAARSAIASLPPSAYNPVNAIYVSASAAVVGHADGDAPVRLVDLAPGCHVLTVDDVDDLDRIKVAALTDGLDRLATTATGAAAMLAGMEALLRDHGEPGREGAEAACIHGDVYGTVSSSSVLVDDAGRIAYRHAPGRPCITAHRLVEALSPPD